MTRIKNVKNDFYIYGLLYFTFTRYMLLRSELGTRTPPEHFDAVASWILEGKLHGAPVRILIPDIRETDGGAALPSKSVVLLQNHKYATAAVGLHGASYKSSCYYNSVRRWTPADCSCRHKVDFRSAYCRHTNFARLHHSTSEHAISIKKCKNFSVKGHSPSTDDFSWLGRGHPLPHPTSLCAYGASIP